MDAEAALRDELVRACKVLYAVKAAGDGLGGHLSARLDKQRMLIKPRPVGWWRLKPEDLGPLSYWPFSAVQALAFLWVSTARRPNELLRLRADCVRTQWEPEMSDEAGDRLPPGAEVVGDLP